MSLKKSSLILLVSVLFAAGINAEVIVYSEGFETTNGNYTHTGTADQWEWGTPAASFTPGPMAAHSGTKCWGTDLDNHVPLNSDSYLTSPPIAIPALSAGEIARVRFYGWIAVDRMYDRGEFLVSSNGSVWETKAELFCRMLGDWTEYYFDVSSYAGGNIYLKFRCRADGQDSFTTIPYNMAGLYIDDVAIIIAEAPLVKTTVTLEACEDQTAFASCPWVYTWNGTEYVKDNDVYSTARGSQNKYADYYNISKPLEASDGNYYLQLRETEYEESYTDMVKLVTIDHPPETNVASDDKGNIRTYSNPAAPFFAIDDEYADVTALVANQDDAGFNGYNDGYIILDFGNPDINNGATLVLRVQGFQVDGDEGNPTFAQPCIYIQIQDAAGNWVTTNKFYPRWNWSTNAYDLSDKLTNSKLIRLYVTSCHNGKYHVIDYIGLDTSAQVPVTTNVLSPISAVHSVEGDITAAINISDNDYAHMATAESITLKFPAPAPAGQARSFALITEGYYQPMGTYFIYTWDGTQWAQRDGWTVEGDYDQTHEFDLSSWLPDPDGEWKVRIWQDYIWEGAGIDFVGASRGGIPGIMSSAYDLKKSSIVTSLLNTSDNIRDGWGSEGDYRNRWVEVTWEPFIANTPPTTNPVTITNVTSNTPTINWTYNDADANPQVQYEVEVWTGPGGTGSNMWDPAVGSGTAVSIVYAGSSLAAGTTYYARVRAFDGYSWGAWSETSWVLPVEGVGILVYDCGGPSSFIQQALTMIGITVFDVRTSSNPVTLTDLETHDILIVGLNSGGDTNGLEPSILSLGITGRILLTGQDADFHYPVDRYPAARTFLIQTISYVEAGEGTGLLAFTDLSDAYSYLPAEWGISATGGIAFDSISSFTPEGIASGVFNGLTPSSMSNWGVSYHAKFNSWCESFVPFELGRSNLDTVTISGTYRRITITKVDDVNDGDCITPDQEINYTINYEYRGLGDTNVSMIDYLPAEVDYFSSLPAGDYNAEDRTITWEIGTVPPNGSGTITIKGFVNYSAEPCGVFTNRCRFEGDSTPYKIAEVNTPVCYWAQTLELTKVDDINDGDCVVPDQNINYTISYKFTGPGDNNVRLIDYLPVGVDYNTSTPPGSYNIADRTVTWNIGTIPPDGSGTFTLTCIVNYDAEPCSIITNSCRIEGDETDKIAEVNTPVCYWNKIIYVDHNATGVNNGLTWENAYLDLQNALNRAAIDGHSEIWVARGTYAPSVSYQGSMTFRLIDGAPVYGHFAGHETSIWQRDFNDINNETILNRIGAVWSQYVVTASGRSQKNILDGFTIKDSIYGAVRIENAYLAISNCIITASGGDGIRAINSTFKVNESVIQNKSIGIFDSNAVFTIDNCIIQNNNSKGISVDYLNIGSLPKSIISNCLIQNNASGNGIYLSRVPSSSSVVITGCNIFGNAAGIYTQNSSSASILDNMIYKNSSMGIILQGAGSTTIRNNTVAGHTAYGIRCMDGGTAPVIKNCIVWGNIDDLYNCSAAYSCTADGNDMGSGNIHCDPCFVNADINDFHLRPASLCIDAGDPCFTDFNDGDIDAECRVMFGKSSVRVDIGADELYWLKADFDRNEIVNFIDYVIWAPALNTADPNKSLDSDNDIDIDDLSRFCDNWLWQGPWLE